jgi:hypothetical protein
MAKQRGNVVTHGLSGKIGGLLVFRQRAGQTIESGRTRRCAPTWPPFIATTDARLVLNTIHRIHKITGLRDALIGGTIL